MPTKRRIVFRNETLMLRAYAQTYLPNEAPLTFAPAVLREAAMTLVDVRNAFRRGRVTSAKVDAGGFLWTVETEEEVGTTVRLLVWVLAEMRAVNLRSVERNSMPMEEPHDAA